MQKQNSFLEEAENHSPKQYKTWGYIPTSVGPFFWSVSGALENNLEHHTACFFHPWARRPWFIHIYIYVYTHMHQSIRNRSLKNASVMILNHHKFFTRRIPQQFKPAPTIYQSLPPTNPSHLQIPPTYKSRPPPPLTPYTNRRTSKNYFPWFWC